MSSNETLAHIQKLPKLFKKWNQLLPKLYDCSMGWGSLRITNRESIYKKAFTVPTHVKWE